MEKFDLRKTADGDELWINKRGRNLMRYPLYNKGTGFTHAERREFGIEGLLPAQYNDINTQAERTYRSIFYNPDPVGRYIGLSALQDRNEHLFYRILHLHLPEVMPIVYTPTVGQASHFYSHIFRRERGIFINPDYSGRIEQVLRDAAPFEDVRLMVVTDNEAILGIGDQGAGGMAISVGKLSLYCAGAGIHPARTLPISLDVGTENRELLDDPLYLGWRHRRLRGDDYFAVVDEFVDAVNAVFPKALIQWEDFSKKNAVTVLDRYRDKITSFNDDIQGTGAVAAAAALAACRISGTDMGQHRIVIYGAGAAGLGIANELRGLMKLAGMSETEMLRAMILMDSRGVIAKDRGPMEDYKEVFAWPAEWLEEIGLKGDDRKDLGKVVEKLRATILVGVSGQPGSFTESMVREMATHTDRPIFMPMSNPTSLSEGIPEELLRWTDGRALIATGSPFDPVRINGREVHIGQANNVFIFPGVGLGTILVGASKVTDSMISAAAIRLADCLNADDLKGETLMPDVRRLWDVCGEVAIAVAKQAVADGVAPEMDDAAVEERINTHRWIPNYPKIICEDSR